MLFYPDGPLDRIVNVCAVIALVIAIFIMLCVVAGMILAGIEGISPTQSNCPTPTNQRSVFHAQARN